VAAPAARIGFFVFVSSGNVYADHSIPGQDEDGELLPARDSDVMVRGSGAARTAIMRVGLIGGPGDIFDRTALLHSLAHA